MIGVQRAFQVPKMVLGLEVCKDPLGSQVPRYIALLLAHEPQVADHPPTRFQPKHGSKQCLRGCTRPFSALHASPSHLAPRSASKLFQGLLGGASQGAMGTGRGGHIGGGGGQ